MEVGVPKCKAVPVLTRDFWQAAEVFRNAVGGWAGFSVVLSAVYLGFRVGWDCVK